MSVQDRTAKVVMLRGEKGDSINSIEKTSSRGLTDTYTITLTSGAKYTFAVNNGKWIEGIAKTGTIGLVDTYTITYNDGTASTFTVTNGEGLQNLQVGGRNYAIGTNNGANQWETSSSDGIVSVSPKVFSDLGNVNGVRINVTEHPTSWSYICYESNNIKNVLDASEGENFTISFDIKTDVASSTSVRINDRNSAYIMADFGDFDTESNKWVHVELTAKARKTTVSDQVVYFYTEQLFKTVKYVEIGNLKLERGNIATDWTPAPEDQERYKEDQERYKIATFTTKKEPHDTTEKINQMSTFITFSTAQEEINETIPDGYKIALVTHAEAYYYSTQRDYDDDHYTPVPTEHCATISCPRYATIDGYYQALYVYFDVAVTSYGGKWKFTAILERA